MEVNIGEVRVKLDYFSFLVCVVPQLSPFAVSRLAELPRAVAVLRRPYHLLVVLSPDLVDSI